MSDNISRGGIVAKLIDVGARSGSAVGKRRTPSILAGCRGHSSAGRCNASMAQVTGMAPTHPP